MKNIKFCQSGKPDFESLYSESNKAHYDDVFLSNIKSLNNDMEKVMLIDDSDQNIFLNNDITYEELQKQISRLKSNKSVGIDYIPNEVLYHHDVVLVLCKLFQFCFKNGCVPSFWLKSILSPIPKGSDKDPYCPLSYRAVSLISCICKVYTGILNTRIATF